MSQFRFRLALPTTLARGSNGEAELQPTAIPNQNLKRPTAEWYNFHVVSRLSPPIHQDNSHNSETMASSTTAGDAMIIFDWDDTILPSSYVDREQVDNIRDMPQEQQNLFREIETCADKCLATAAKYGEVSFSSCNYQSHSRALSRPRVCAFVQVVIITNSDEGWVNYSAERYLPNLIPVLKNYRIISARTRYEKFYPNQPLCWKAAAFAHEVNEHFCSLEEAHHMLNRECAVARSGSRYDTVPDMEAASTDDSSLEDTSISSSEVDSPGAWSSEHISTTPVKPAHQQPPTTVTATPAVRREIISFGDSIEERTAVKIVSDQLDALPKSVKFLGNPSPLQIIGQLTMLTHHMSFVCQNVDTLDLEISLKQAEKCAKGYLVRNEVNIVEQVKPTIFQRILRASSSASAQFDSSCGEVEMEP